MPDGNDYRIIRNSRRKNIALRIAPDGVLEILSPPNTAESFLLRLLQSNRETVVKMRQRFEALKIPQLSLEEGAQLTLLGRKFPLHLSCRLRMFDGSRFIVPRGSAEDMKASLILLYRELANKYLLRRAAELEALTGLKAASYRINSADTRWGSCNSKKCINFSWKLVQCPQELIDYVIIHELAHLKELNHSARFWAVVRRWCPEYLRCRRELKKFGSGLNMFR